MAIGTNDAIDKFGTQDIVTVSTGTSLVSAAAFSTASDVVAGGWTNTDDAPLGMFVLKATWATLPTVLDPVNLYARLMNVQSTNDTPQPDATYTHKFIGAFLVDTVTTAQYLMAVAALDNTMSQQIFEFYIENATSQTISAGWEMWVTPFTQGPAA